MAKICLLQGIWISLRFFFFCLIATWHISWAMMMTYCLASNLSANHCNLSHILHQRYHTDKWRLDKPQCIRQYISFYKLWAIASAKRQICNDNNLTHTFMHWRSKYADNLTTDGWALLKGQVDLDFGIEEDAMVKKTVKLCSTQNHYQDLWFY